MNLSEAADGALLFQSLIDSNPNSKLPPNGKNRLASLVSFQIETNPDSERIKQTALIDMSILYSASQWIPATII
jgi:hypothetical protein